MPVTPIKFQDRDLRLYKCAVDPDLTTRTVLVEDQWDYVDMWLKRQGKTDALFFWRQAEAFAKASKNLPNTSSPLTRYYSALNASKALLLAKGRPTTPYHGVTGKSTNTAAGPATLAGEIVRVKGGGTLPELCRYFGESVNKEQYNLEDILYNLPYIHRAYSITFPARPELFVPIASPAFVRVDGTSQAYFCFKIADKPYCTPQVLAALPGYEKDAGVADAYVVRMRNRLRWKDGVPVEQNVTRFKTYYRTVRRSTCYIRGITRLWYIKLSGPAPIIARSSLTLTYMAMHRLSELARYSPDVLSKHFESQHNWLLSEFINLSLAQFLDEVSAEMTGHEFMQPGVASR